MSSDAVAQRPPVLWRNISFHILWISTFASGFGDRMAMFAAMAMLGYSQEGIDDSSIQAAIHFFFFLPYLIWSPMAGWVTDRLPRKWVLLAADQCRGIILLCALLLAPATGVMVPEEHRWLVWLVMLALGVMAATFVPARLSVVPSVVGTGLLTRANGAVVSMGVIGNLAGMLIGGALVERSVQHAIFVGAACYIISGAFWIFLSMPWERKRTGGGTAGAHGGPLEAIWQVRDGLRYAWNKTVVWRLIVMAALVWGGTAIYVPAMGTINVQLYGGDLETLGYVLAMVGAGMLVGAVALAVLNPLRGLEVIMTAAFFGLAACLALQTVVPVFAIGLLLSFGVGLAGALLMVPLHALIQRVSANHIRGRVFGAKEVVGELGMVGISLLIWRVPNTDPVMRPLMIMLAVLYAVAGIYGLIYYVMRGPIGTAMLNTLWRSIRFLSEAMHQLRIEGRQHVPREGPALIVANHTAGTDPMLIQSAVPRLIRWMMAEEYMLPGLGWIWRRIEPIGVHRSGRDSTAARQAVTALRNGHVVAVFPEGEINRGDEPLQSFSAGVGLVAVRGRAPVIPAWIEGTPRGRVLSAYFRFTRSRVRFGEPIILEDHHRPAEAAELIRQRVQALGQQADEDQQAATAAAAQPNR